MIVRCDADTVPPHDWLERIANRFLREADLAVLTGPGEFYGTGPVRARLAGLGYMQAYFLLMDAALAHWPTVRLELRLPAQRMGKGPPPRQPR